MKKKLLFVNGHLNVGGVENSLVNVLKNIDFNLYEVDLLLLEDLGDYIDEVPKEVNIIFNDITKTYGPIMPFIYENVRKMNWYNIGLRSIFVLEKLIGVKALYLARPFLQYKKEYDCAIAYRVGICTDLVGYTIKSKVKMTWWHHGSFEYDSKLISRWKKVFKRFDKLIAVSDSSKEMLAKNIHGIKYKISTIHNMINTQDIVNKAKVPPGFNIKYNETTTLVSVGRLSPEKGMINCVQACKQLIDSGYNIQWYLIGEGEQRGEIERCIKENKLEDHIFLLGSISNPYPYIKNAHIYVHPSLVESMSISVLEALALNTPVTVARSMGPEEFIRHKENGLLVNPTPDGLYEGIVSLLKDDELYNKLKNDKTDVLKKYSPELIMSKIYAQFTL